MNIKNIIKKIIFPNTYSNEAYKKYLRKIGGVAIGEHTVIYAPNHTYIDINKKYMIEIGDYCKIVSGVTILAHDYSRSIISKKYGPFMGGMLPVKIGNNVFLGKDATILMGTIIGDNCIVGAGAVVKGKFPEGVVIAGNPAKIVCTLEEYYEKCKKNWIKDAQICAKTIYRRTGRKPYLEEMSDCYFELYMPHTSNIINEYPEYFSRSADDSERIKQTFLRTEAKYQTYDKFLEDCGIE